MDYCKDVVQALAFCLVQQLVELVAPAGHSSILAASAAPSIQFPAVTVPKLYRALLGLNQNSSPFVPYGTLCPLGCLKCCRTEHQAEGVIGA